MSFESELSSGRFCVLSCTQCKKIVWPPAEFCSRCFGAVTLKHGDLTGRVVEFSEYDGHYFCMVEFEGGSIQVMAKILDRPTVGQSVKIVRCGITDGNYFFNVE